MAGSHQGCRPAGESGDPWQADQALKRTLAGRAGGAGLPGGRELPLPAGRPSGRAQAGQGPAQGAALGHFAAKDILRAAGLPLLPADDSEVASDLEKIKNGIKLSPVLLVEGTPLWVADGYHRICTSYHLDEKEPVPCRIAPRAAKD